MKFMPLPRSPLETMLAKIVWHLPRYFGPNFSITFVFLRRFCFFLFHALYSSLILFPTNSLYCSLHAPCFLWFLKWGEKLSALHNTLFFIEPLYLPTLHDISFLPTRFIFRHFTILSCFNEHLLISKSYCP